MKPVILKRVEEKTGDCQKCFYYGSDSDGGNECCQRPTDAAYNEPCFDEEPGGKYYVFIEEKN